MPLSNMKPSAVTGAVQTVQSSTGVVDPVPVDNRSDLELALRSLDHSCDLCWTKKGLPDCNALTEIIGRKVTRAEINKLATDYVRAV